MATRIFRVDLSDNARDYRPTATEPGLGMLDRAGANHGILRRWLGDFVADPEFQGDHVNFFVREEERGRLENIECYPATKHDLEGALKADLEALDARIRKAKPDSRTEQLLHKIVRSTFTSITRDLDQSDHDSFFFQYREPGQPWKLLWCWGYQRADIQPGKALICSNNNCQQLYVYRQDGDDLCPGCTTKGGRKKGGLPFGLTWAHIGTTALALLLLLMLFMLLNPPTLVATPGRLDVPAGGRLAFKITDQRYFFFSSDVTDKVLASSENPDIVTFDGRGAKAKAKQIGTTLVSFRLQDRVTTATVNVTIPSPPDSISVEPKELHLGIGSVGQVHVFGHYKDQSDVDLTDSIEWVIKDEKVVFGAKGLFEGSAAGETTVTARMLINPLEDKSLEANVAVDVKKVTYKTVDARVTPRELQIGEKGEIAVDALDEAGTRYRFHGSSQLHLDVQPSSIGKLDEREENVVGSETGKGDLVASLTKRHGSLVGKGEFQVGDTSLIAAGTFELVPGGKELTIRVGEYLKFQVISASKAPIESSSDNPDVVGINGPTAISGLKVGTANVTLKQAGLEKKIAVNVIDTKYTQIAFLPRVITLRVSEVQPVRVMGTTEDGKVVEVDPKTLTWLRQPLVENAFFDRQRMLISGKSPTLEAHPLVATVDGLKAEGAVEVLGAAGSAELVIEDDGDFGVYPPIRSGAFGPHIGVDDFSFTRDGIIINKPDSASLIGTGRIPRGSRVVRIRGRDLAGMDAGQLRDYLVKNPLMPGDDLEYLDITGNRAKIKLGKLEGVVEVKLVGVRPLNISGESFNAEVLFDLKLSGDYRLTDSSDQPLSDWTPFTPGENRLVSAKITRAAEPDATYALNIERKIGDKIDKLQVKFKIKAEDSP